MYGNSHPVANCLNAAMWLALAATLYGAFSKASLFLVGASAILFLILIAINWYVTVYVLRNWPAFRSSSQR